MKYADGKSSLYNKYRNIEKQKQKLLDIMLHAIACKFPFEGSHYKYTDIPNICIWCPCDGSNFNYVYTSMYVEIIVFLSVWVDECMNV